MQEGARNTRVPNPVCNLQDGIHLDGLPGEVKKAVHLQHLNTFWQMLARKKLADDLTKCTKAVEGAAAAVRKYSKVPNGEKTSEKAERITLLEPAKHVLVTSEVAEAAKVASVYELFRKGLKEDPELQWDRIMEDMHTKDHGRT